MNKLGNISLFEGLSFVISVIALLITIYTYRHSLKLEQKKNTIEAYIDLQEDLHFIHSYKYDEIELFVDDPKSNEYKLISSSIARIEIFATGVMSNVYDYSVTYDISHGYLDGAIYERIKCILDMKKELSGKEYYENTRHLIERMKKERK